MKVSVYVTALCLAGLGLAAPAPVHNERGLQAERALPGFDIDARDVGIDKRKSKPKTTKKADPVVTTKKPDPTTSKAATTTSKSSSTSSVVSSTKASSTTVISTTSTSASSSSSSVASTTSTTASSTSASSIASTSGTTSAITSATSSGTASGTTSGTTSGTITSSLSSTLSTTASGNGTVTGKPSITKLSSTITSSSSLTATGNSTVVGKPSLTHLSNTITPSTTLTTTGNSTVTGRKTTDTLSTITSSATGNSTVTGLKTSTTLLSSTTAANATATTLLSSTATANATATTSGAFCTRPTSTGKAGKVSARAEGDNAGAGSSCGGEEYIDFGNGWRTPVTSEQSSSKVKTPTDNGGMQLGHYRTMKDDFPKPPKEKNKWGAKAPPARDCPADPNNVLTMQVEGHDDTGALNTPPRDGVLFYSVVQATEHEWAAAQSKGFYFMLDLVKDTWIDWVRFAMGCRQFWPNMSKAVALLAQGDVHVLLPSKTFEVGEVPVWPKIDRNGKAGGRTVWDEHEWPTLLRENQGACRIWRWNKSTNQPDLLAVRTNGGCSGYPASPDGATKKTYNWDSNTLA